MHSEESEVAEIMAFGKWSVIRKNMLLTRLCNLGSYNHNKEVLKTGCGKLSAVYWPSHSIETDAYTYIPSCHCFGSYRREQLWCHVKMGKPRNANSNDSTSLRPTVSSDLLIPVSFSTSLNVVLAGMKKDQVTAVVKCDVLVQQLWRRLMQRVSHSSQHQNDIRNRLRQLAELILKFCSFKPEFADANMWSIIDACNFQAILECVRSISGLSLQVKQIAH